MTGAVSLTLAGQAEHAAAATQEVTHTASWLACLPFVLLLLCIAILPLIRRTHHWWEENRNKLLVAAVLAGVTLGYYQFRGFGVHHSDAGSQYLSMRYTNRLADVGIAPSVGTRGDAFDNALAESVIGLFKTEVIQRRGPWRGREAVEFATLAWGLGRLVQHPAALRAHWLRAPGRV